VKKITGLIILSLAFLFESSPTVSAQSSLAAGQRQSLGVNVEETGYGLTVRSMIPGSAAVGQLELGDVLQFLAADGHPVYATLTLQQMKIAKEAIGLDVPAYLQIQRGGVTRVFDVEFASSGTIIGNGRVMSIDDALLSTADAGGLESKLSSPAAANGPLAAPSLDFKRMVLAGLQEGKDGTNVVVLTKQRWAQEFQQIVYTAKEISTVTKQRTKTVPKEVVVDGKSVTEYAEVIEEYEERVPHEVQKTMYLELLKPVPHFERVEVPIDSIKAWSVDGTSLSAVELEARLSGTQRVFILPSGTEEYIFDPFFTAVISNDIIVMKSPEGLGALPAFFAPAAPIAPASSAPAGSRPVPAAVPVAPAAVPAPISEAPAPPAAEAAPPAAEAAPPAAEATPLEAPPAEPELPSTETPVEGSSQEN